MKTNLVCVLSISVLLSFAQGLQAKSWINPPISDSDAAVGTAAIGVTTFVAAKVICSMDKIVGMNLSKGNVGFSGNFLVRAFSGKTSTLVATITAGIASYCSWWVLSKYRAEGYLNAGNDILSGECCGNKGLLEIIKFNCHDSQVAANMTIDLFSARKNELAKAVIALEKLFEELSLADYYLEVAMRGLDDFNLELATSSREIIAATIKNLKAVSLIIKSSENYSKQYEDELKEMRIQAQYATARAIRAAGMAQAAPQPIYVHS